MTAPSVPTAAPALHPRLGGSLRRHVAVSASVCLGIAVVLTAVMPSRDPLWMAFLLNWLYSQCIGASIQALVEAGRLGMAAWLRQRRPDDPTLAQGWPGWRWFAPWLVFASVAGYLFGATIADAIVGGTHVRALLGGSLRPLVFLAMITLGSSLLTSYGFYTRSRLQAAEARTAAIAREAAEHQLRLLEAQLEPHMLFNTLANLRVLIGLDPARAQAMLDHLIAFLRATLRASQDRQHALSTEFARLADYLALMQIRMGSRLAVDFDLPDAVRDAPVPPLLLQPLVENAIRHGLEPTVAGGRIAVSARADGGMLELVVADTGAGLPAGPTPGDDLPASTSGGGFGLRQIRQRLATLHGPAADFTLRPGPEGRGTVARIRLPLAVADRAVDTATDARLTTAAVAAPDPRTTSAAPRADGAPAP